MSDDGDEDELTDEEERAAIDEVLPRPGLALVEVEAAVAAKADDPLRAPERSVVREFDTAGCWHNRIVYSLERREVTCKDCDKWIDPFVAMLHMVRYLDQYLPAKAHIDRLRARVAEYEGQEKLRLGCLAEELYSDVERGMGYEKLHAHHRATGHPPEKIRLTATMLHCYCGLSMRREFNRALELAVLAARKGGRTR